MMTSALFLARATTLKYDDISIFPCATTLKYDDISTFPCATTLKYDDISTFPRATTATEDMRTSAYLSSMSQSSPPHLSL